MAAVPLRAMPAMYTESSAGGLSGRLLTPAPPAIDERTPVTRSVAPLLTGVALASALAIAVPLLAQTGVARKPLITADLPIAGFQTVQAEVTIAPGGREGRHLHAGTLVTHVVAGEMTLELKDKPTKLIKAGDSVLIEAGQVHEGVNKGTVPLVMIGTFVVPKDKPLTTPAP